MKISFIAWTPFTYGGIPRAITSIANELSKIHDVHILRLKKDTSNVYGLDLSRISMVTYEQSICSKIRREILQRLERFLPIYRLKIILKNHNRIRYPRSYRTYIENYLKKGSFDMVIAATGFGESVMLANFIRKVDSKLIGWLHTSFEHEFRGKGYSLTNRLLLAKYFLPMLNQVVVLSNNDEYLYKKMNIKAISIYNSVSPQFLNITSHVQNDTCRFISVGSLSKVKGADILLEGFRIFARHNTTWRLDIFGEGPLKEPLSKRIVEYGLEKRVSIYPYSATIEKEYAKSNAFIFCSRCEGFGIVLIEAMAVGVPVIVSDIPITRELLAGKGVAEFFVSENHKSLADAMLRVVNGSCVDAKKNGPEYAKKFSIENIGEKWNTIFEKLLAG